MAAYVDFFTKRKKINFDFFIKLMQLVNFKPTFFCHNLGKNDGNYFKT